MKDYKTNNYEAGNNESSILLLILFIVMAYLVTDLSWQQIYDYFNF